MDNTKPRHTCAELGICQSLPVRCLLCKNDPAPWNHEEITCTPWEKMGYWITVALCTLCTVATVGGIAGYFSGWWTA